ncbi:MAG: SurA N-terminal domain-containing protein [Candidatus Poribacteria bacterium]|nr:SurA N-terminal domain-containing protein [Candidatus Poribacteria bacterium]
MMRYITFLILLCIGGNVHAQTLIDSIVAVVNEDAITRSELEDEFRIATVFLGIRADAPPTLAEKRAALHTLINRTFVLQEAERRGIVVTERNTQVAAKIAEISVEYASDTALQSTLQHSQLEKSAIEAWVYDQLIYDEFFRRIFFNTVNSERVAQLAKSYYNTNGAEFIVPPTVTFKSLLIVIPKNGSEVEKQEAETLVQKLNERLQRGQTFQAVRETYETQLELRFEVTTLEIDTPLGAIVTKLQVSERSTPFRVSEGYQIVERIRNNSAYQKTYPEVSEEITERIRRELANEQFETWLIQRKEEETWHILDDELAQEKSEVK